MKEPMEMVICTIFFVVCSLLCSERFLFGYSGFPLLSKTSISKFKFYLDYCQALYHEPMALLIVQVVPVFDVKFTFTILAIDIVLTYCFKTDV